ncbi:VWA domain-containing protein [Pseudenhygromyxa sp. WMMC2535]|uniref:vWA domain-containing protein n=1 Tax=Pseudenhygromyxa sp. WMMC2535 TaxID=2712867 RepID=UPI0015565B6F|nr:vWA domain-containing protein [Pseudenhygromyxa sp. WMMC2535]NVB42006.1 VWA domain-containing protein [Pseudenhygromyxa sp. WMMC2535]
MGCRVSVDPVELESELEPENQLKLAVNKDVDVLLVIDNSGSMGEEQANLAANFAAMIDVLEDKTVRANYRIAVTTTDNDNPWCTGTSPEGGNFVASSCRSRLEQFSFGDDVDVQAQACLDICALDDEALVIQPTTTERDSVAAPRPWLERIEGQTNLPAGVGTAEAFACLAPQGIDGCGFESPLESMYLALLRSETMGEANYGFLRRSAILAIIIVTDEVDCSYDKNWATIFALDGERTFWSDPDDEGPTSAVCWNAGVTCQGDPASYESCDPVDLDVLGVPTEDPDAAVLHPMSRYIDFVADLEAQKKALDPSQEVIVALIGGVDAYGTAFYADASSSNPDFQHDFGIGPGCEGQKGEAAVPPVRNREFVDAFTPGNLFSVCSDDYTGPLETIAARMRDQIIPSCYAKCVADTHPDIPLLQPSCEVEELVPGGEPALLPECLRDGEWGPYLEDPEIGGYRLPEDAQACYAMLVDPDESTPEELDDMAPECIGEGINMEFEIVRRPGFPAAGGTKISGNCVLSESPELDCPS